MRCARRFSTPYLPHYPFLLTSDKLNEVEVDGKGHVTKITSSADAHKPKAIGSESSLHPREANLAFIIHVSSGEMETFCRMFCRVWHPEVIIE